MRITHRSMGNKEFWHKRWNQVEVEDEAKYVDVYSVKYALMAIERNGGLILEVRCGNGSLTDCFHNHDHEITVFDFIEAVISKSKILMEDWKRRLPTSWIQALRIQVFKLYYLSGCFIIWNWYSKTPQLRCSAYQSLVGHVGRHFEQTICRRA